MKAWFRGALPLLLVLPLLACGDKKKGHGDKTYTTGDDCVTTAPVHDHTPYNGELFDAHGHLMPKWDASTLNTAMTDGGLMGMTLLGPANTAAVASSNPDTFVGCVFVDVLDGLVTEADLKPVTDALNAGAGCIGEVKVRHFASGHSSNDVVHEADNPFMTALYNKAREYGVPINVHIDYEAGNMDDFERALENSRDPTLGNTNIIWAHMGDAPPGAVGDLMAKHENLYVDMSSRNPLCSYAERILPMEEQRLDEGDYTLHNDWKLLFEEHKDRVLFGTDIGPGDRHEVIAEVVDYYRVLLGQLSPEAQTKIGKENALKLFPSVSSKD